jgi:excisionase family DNA binding protein
MTDPAFLAELRAMRANLDRLLGQLGPPPPANDPPAAPLPSDLISSGAAAKVAQVSKLTVRRWCERFDIGHKVGGRWLVSRSKLKAFMSAQAA